MTEALAIAPPRIYPTFRYCDARVMIDWLVSALGFAVHAKFEANGVVNHAELALGSSMIMVGQTADDRFGSMVGAPGANGGKAVYIAVDDPDSVYTRAKAAGAVILEEPVDRSYGSREFICRDPEGNVWCIGTYWPKAGDAPADASS